MPERVWQYRRGCGNAREGLAVCQRGCVQFMIGMEIYDRVGNCILFCFVWLEVKILQLEAEQAAN